MEKIKKTYHRTFLFYDYETFGTNVYLDKPAQFASIRTDIHLNIIEKPKCFYCLPSDDYLPDPQSILITGITPQYLEKYGSNECIFSKKIHNVLIQPNTCIIGYNNIKFDDEITRNIFYRNFFDPYEWSWKSNNSRWDLLDVVRACYALRPQGINWSYDKLGFPSFNLSKLSKANNIIHYKVHDAISDVYATIKLAQLIKKKQPKLFNFFYKYRKKNNLYKLIDIHSFKPIVYISSFFGASRYNISCILPIAWDLHSKNILIAIDLFKDVNPLISFCKNLFFKNISFKDLFNLGVILIYLNRCPILAPFQSLRKEDIKRLNFDSFLYQNKINVIQKNYSILSKINIILSCHNIKKKQFNSNLKYDNVDLTLYNNFFNYHDKKLIKLIRYNKPNFWKNITLNFYDIRLKDLFFRYKARNFFNILDVNEKKLWLNYCLDIFNSSYLKKYIFHIEQLLHIYVNDKKNTSLLKNLLKYVFKKYKILFYQKINLD